MRILLTADPFIPVPPIYYGGIERIVGSLIVGLRQRGHEVGLVAHPESAARLDYFAAWPENNPWTITAHVRNMFGLKRALAEFEPDLIHSYSRLGYLLPLLLRKLPKIMSYQRMTGGRQTRIAASFGGRSIAFTGCSEFIAGMGRRYGGAWRAIPNFVDTEFYRFVPTVPSDAPLVFLSRVEEIKGPHIAIEIAKKTGRRLLIAGNYGATGTDREYWEQRIVPELGRNGIEYVGPVDDDAKNTLLGSAAALIVPIQWDEPFGIVFAEALACGTPVIASARGALPEIVREGQEGFMIDNIEQGSMAVDRLAQIKRRDCRDRAEQTFSVAAVVPLYEDLYRTLVEAR